MSVVGEGVNLVEVGLDFLSPRLPAFYMILTHESLSKLLKI